jgi:hypothetical protein
LDVKATWWNVKELKYIVLAISHVGIISFPFQSRKLRDSGCIAFEYYLSGYKVHNKLLRYFKQFLVSFNRFIM